MRHRIRLLAVVAIILVAGACAQTNTGVFRNDLNDDIVARVSAGQSAQEVTALLGTPYQRIRFDNLKATAWDYMFKDSWGYWVALSIMVGDDGLVVNKVLRRIDVSDRH